MLKKRIAAGLMASTFSLTTFASVDSEMQSWFNDIGATGNITTPQSVQGQTGTTYTAGSLFMRTPVKNYSLSNVAAPSMKIGCGGIDLFAGSFSFISGEQLNALIRNIGNNAAPMALSMAIKAYAPQLWDGLQWLQDQAAKINSMNINSCQAATGLVYQAGAAVSKDWKERNNASAGALTGLYEDGFKSLFELRKDNSAEKNVNNQIKAKDQEAYNAVKSQNIVWEALARSNAPVELKQLMMSLIGTVIILNKGDGKNLNGKEESIEKPIGTIKDFSSFIGTGLAPKHTISVLTCIDNDTECWDVAPRDVQVISLLWQVRQTLEKAALNITNKTKQSNWSDLDRRIMTNSNVPLWRIASISAISSSGPALTNAYSEAIAVELAWSWFEEMIKELTKALSKQKESRGLHIQQVADEMMGRIYQVRMLAQTTRNTLYQNSKSMMDMQRQIQWLHETTMRSIPVDMQKSINSFSK